MTFVINSKFESKRKKLIQTLKIMGIKDENVLSAIYKVPRHLFVDESIEDSAYENISLPIGFGQTISQPYIVAKMSELLIEKRTNPVKKVLEIGTGCGYQTAVLEEIGIPHIYSVERIKSLFEIGQKNLRGANYLKPKLICSDGYLGLPDKAFFDAIIVTAAPDFVPVPLLDQLAVWGRLVLPLAKESKQHLWVIEKQNHGFKETCVVEVKFVPLLKGLQI